MIRPILRAITPEPIRAHYHRINALLRDHRERGRSHAEIFAEIYRSEIWGQGSGTTSDPESATPYVQYARRFIVQRGIKTVVDLGCGDARLGRAINDGLNINYIGVDIVPGMTRHRPLPGEQFVCADIVNDPLPPGDLCLIAHVLQHLDNASVAAVLSRARAKYRWLLITEVQASPAKFRRPNVDKPTGPSTRVHRHSGLDPAQPPFCIPCQRVCSFPHPRPNVGVVTFLINGE
jgi:SAM-dependent methyltransferase